MDEVANQIAKSRYMFGGQFDCPLVLRMPYGIGRSGGGHHSNSVEAWFVNIWLRSRIPSMPPTRARISQDRRARPHPCAALFLEAIALGQPRRVADTAASPSASRSSDLGKVPGRRPRSGMADVKPAGRG